MGDGWDIVRREGRTLQEVLNDASLDDRTFSQWVSDELQQRGIKKTSVVRRSLLNQTFAYQIMAGMRKPSRDKLIQLCFGMQLNEREACELLERGGMSALRPTCRRDVIVAFCLSRGMGVRACEDLLSGLGEQPLIGINRKN